MNTENDKSDLYKKTFEELNTDQAKFILEKAELKLANSAKTFDDIENKIFKLLAFQGLYFLGLIKGIIDLKENNSIFSSYLLFFSVLLAVVAIYHSLKGFVCYKFGVTGSESHQFIYEESHPEYYLNILIGYSCLNTDKDLSENIIACNKKSEILNDSINLTFTSIAFLAATIFIKLFLL